MPPLGPRCRCRGGRRGRADASRERATATSKIGASGLPATVANRPIAVCTADTRVPLPGAIPRACGIVQSVLVAIQGIPPSSSGSAAHTRLRRGRPADLRREALHDSRRGVVRTARDHVAGLLDLDDQAFAADDEDRRTARHALGEQAHRGLGTRDDVIGRGRCRPRSREVRGHRCIGTRGVVRDVAEPTAPTCRVIEALDRVRQRTGPGVHDAVQVSEDASTPSSGDFSRSRENSAITARSRERRPRQRGPRWARALRAARVDRRPRGRSHPARHPGRRRRRDRSPR